MRLCDAFDFVNAKRSIYPNIGFIKQLMIYECELNNMEKSSFNYNEYLIKAVAASFVVDEKIVLNLYIKNNYNLDSLLTELSNIKFSKNIANI